jgi:hypothetical protein
MEEIEDCGLMKGTRLRAEDRRQLGTKNSFDRLRTSRN